MKKILLVDDEAYILDLLEGMIEWEFYGFEIVGKAKNASDAMKIFRKESPDIIITDICMEQISGMEFITRVRMQDSRVKIIILSAYDRFEYAQKALKLNVDGYLLKPVNREELLNTLLEVQKSLTTGEEYEDKISRLQSSLDTLQRKYLEGQLAGIYSADAGELPQELRKGGDFHVLSVRTIDRKEIVFLERDLKSLPEVESFLVFTGDGLFAVFLQDRYTSGAAEEAVGMLKRKYCDTDQSILCGAGDDREQNLGKMCFRSKSALNSLFYEEKKFFARIRGDREPTEPAPQFSQEKLLLWLIGKETDKCREAFGEYITACRRAGAPRENVIETFTDCVGTVLSAVKEQGAREELMALSVEAGNAVRSAQLLQAFERCMACAESGNVQLNKAGLMIADAREYMKMKGFDENFSIDMLAEHLNISKSWLSRRYKEETGESIWNYVMRLRIARARELLTETDATNYAIARAIGYSSEYHFSRAFSKTVGMPPSTYKKMYLQMEKRQSGRFDKKE